MIEQSLWKSGRIDFENPIDPPFSLIHHSIENIVIGTLIKAFFQKYFLSVKVVACTE